MVEDCYFLEDVILRLERLRTSIVFMLWTSAKNWNAVVREIYRQPTWRTTKAKRLFTEVIRSTQGVEFNSFCVLVSLSFFLFWSLNRDKVFRSSSKPFSIRIDEQLFLIRGNFWYKYYSCGLKSCQKVIKFTVKRLILCRSLSVVVWIWPIVDLITVYSIKYRTLWTVEWHNMVEYSLYQNICEWT